MSNNSLHPGHEPSRAEVDALRGPVLVEFGAEWCGHCQALRPAVTELLAAFPQVRYLRIEDGKGQPLGRSFRVKLWPTLVFMRDGTIVQRMVRPGPQEVRQGFAAIG